MARVAQVAQGGAKSMALHTDLGKRIAEFGFILLSAFVDPHDADHAKDDSKHVDAAHAHAAAKHGIVDTAPGHARAGAHGASPSTDGGHGGFRGLSDFLNGLAERFSHNQHNGKEEAEKVTDEMLGISKGHRKSKNPGTGSGGPKDTE